LKLLGIFNPGQLEKADLLSEKQMPANPNKRKWQPAKVLGLLLVSIPAALVSRDRLGITFSRVDR
jgi:hypothetical protein